MRSKYFKLSEFACSCGCGTNKINRTFLKILISAREKSIDFNGREIPFIITSGYRCDNHQESIKYKKRNPNSSSEHTKGLAVDILVKTSRERAVILSALMEAGLTRFGISHNKNGFSFIHTDMGDMVENSDKPMGVIWTY